jgi:hypothetical protein
MWLVRFRIGVARPRALGSHRFNVGPGPTWISLTVRASNWSRPPLSRALATADLSIFSIRRAAFRGVSASTFRASPAGRPRMVSATWRALRGDVRIYLPTAFASMIVPVSFWRSHLVNNSRNCRHLLFYFASKSISRLMMSVFFGFFYRLRLAPYKSFLLQ